MQYKRIYKMALTEGDKAICAQIAGEVITKVLEGHVKTCPYGIQIKVSKAYLIGVCIGSGLAGGGVGAAIFAAVLEIFKVVA